MFCFGFHKVLRGGSTILVYLKITMECFVLLSIMMNPQQPRGINEEDMQRAIESYKGDFLKKILQGETRKKVENFLDQQQMISLHDYQKDPMLYQTAKEIYETPGYDPASKAEAKRQLDLMDAGLPRFPTS